MKDRNKFLELAKKGIVTVEFRKIDTQELRIMPCTLNNKLSNGKVREGMKQNANNDDFAVWSLDKNAWRSFRTNTVEDWYEGYPKEEN